VAARYSTRAAAAVDDKDVAEDVQIQKKAQLDVLDIYVQVVVLGFGVNLRL